MKFRWESRETRDERLGHWHLWFAWRPVKIGKDQAVWLERVERRGGWRRHYKWEWPDWEWEYRVPEDAE